MRLDFRQRTVRTFENDDLRIEWTGFVYLDGSPSGLPSIERFAELVKTGVAAATTCMEGVYFISVLVKESGDRFAFVDSAGLFHAYCSEHAFSSSFLDLVASEGLTPDDLDPEAVTEFFHLQGIFFGRTFFQQIRKIGPEEIVYLPASGAISILEKPVRRIEDPPERSLEDCLRSFVASVKSGGERVSVDLTGGVDSRMVAVLLQHLELPFEAAISGVRGMQDIELAGAVARALNVDLRVTYHDISNLEEDLRRIFAYSDGLSNVARLHRPFQLQLDRARRGCTLMVSGVGGELFQDAQWVQDFPFYLRRKANLERYFALRTLTFQPNHEMFRGAYRPASEALRSRFIAGLAEYAVSGNSYTYDRIYYHCKLREVAGQFLTTYSRVLGCHAAFLGRETMAYAYNLPRSQRFMANFHRRTITRYNPDAARLMSTRDTTLSDDNLQWSIDLFRYVFNKVKRLGKKAGERFLGRTYFQEDVNDPMFGTRLRELPLAREAIARLKDYRILEGSVELDAVPRYLGPMLTVSMLIEQLEQGGSFQEADRLRPIAVVPSK